MIQLFKDKYSNSLRRRSLDTFSGSFKSFEGFEQKKENIDTLTELLENINISSMN
jgi:hypothetical protein